MNNDNKKKKSVTNLEEMAEPSWNGDPQIPPRDWRGGGGV